MLRLKELRIAAGLTQVDLAKAVGVTQGTVAEWERGGCLPSVAKLPKLAELFHCTIDELFRREAG